VEGFREDSLAAGTEALRAGDWLNARDSFRAALEREETPEALAGLGESLWWLGETQPSVEYRERAYAGFRRRAEHAQAVNLALGLSIHYDANVGNAAAAAGWLARAKRLVEENALEEFGGWIELFEAGEASDPAAAEGRTREALAIAQKSADPDLELCALAQLGSTLVSQGRIDEGVALLDEAMAGSLGGEGGNFDTVVFTSCNMVGSCTRCADFERAVQWIRTADRFTQRYGCPFLYLYCRVHYGAILIATGDWQEAESQLATSMREAETSQRPLHANARATLAALRFAQGRLEEAEDLIEGLDGQSPAAPVAAAIHLARGAPVLAAALARRGLDGADFLDRAVLLELLGEAEIAQGNSDEAAAHGRALAEQGAARSSGLVRARGHRLLGRALGRPEDLHTAIAEFSRLGMPYETAWTRLILAAVLRTSEPEVAAAEARAALTVFENLGAGAGADAAAALLRELGVKAARLGPKGVGTLTKRETEVLGLLEEGLSNPEIAERLYLSRKTVEHHVASILSKLGARNRSDALRLIRKHSSTK
jgi:DNA-binding CsgD family transcriptional regulator/tetratricopeptide (TPR) repeat protein